MGPTLRLAGAVAAGALGAVPLPAQQPVPPTTYAITNARLVPVSGPAIERGTIVIRNGLIVAVGANAAVPADARVLDGVGLTVYPGLIDTYNSLGMPAAPAGGGGPGGGGGGQAAAQAAGAPNSNYPAGIRPERRAVDVVRASDAFAAANAAGLTAANTALGAGVLRGQSALINLSSGEGLSLVVRAPVAQHVGFSGGGGGYPNSLMGVITSIRQLLLDAQRYAQLQQAYARNPRGMRRPEPDPSLEAVLPLLAREQPVIFAASTQREIERALAIAEEFNLRAIIAGGSEAHLVADRLKAGGVPVLLSTNFPRRTAAPTPDADPDPVRLLRQRAEAPTVPGKLHQAGVRFAFQSGGITSWGDWLANARRAVEGGLAADQALRAMTLDAADILGAADRLGSLEPGKIANLTVTRGDLFSAEGRVAHIFVDGREVALPAASGGGGPPRAGATGEWTTAVEVEGLKRLLTLTLRQVGEELVGFFQGDFGSGEISQGRIDAEGRFHFTALLTLPATSEEAQFTGTWRGNDIAGTVIIVGHDAGRFAGARGAAR